MRFGVLAIVCSSSLLAGCSGGSIIGLNEPAITSPGAASPGAHLTGAVFGGQQAIVGAQVYLFAANTTGYGGAGIAASSNNASVSLLNAPGYVTTGANGAFSITSDYTCTAGQQVYLYAVGGNSGSGTNSASGLLAVLGNCPVAGTFPSSTFIYMNEVSTIAAAYAFAGFATDATHVSSSGTTLAKTGIANAFASAANLETLSTGAALATTPAVNGTVPQTEINTLADILAACVNSNGAVTGGGSPTPCYTLFTNALSGGTTGTQPTDTATAAINIAHNPSANISALYNLSTTNPPFQTALTTAPNDFTIAIYYLGGGLDNPSALAVDAAGNVWVANKQCGCISEFNSSGQPMSGASGYTNAALNFSEGIAIDRAGDIWVSNFGGSSLSEYVPTTATFPSGSSGYAGGGLNEPVGIAFDGSGNLWVANEGNFSISEFNSSGGAVSGSSGDTGGGLGNSMGIAVNGAGNVWVTDNSFNHISEFNSSGTAITNSNGYSGGGVESPQGIAIDASGDVWVADNGHGQGISELSASGTGVSSNSSYTGGGLHDPYGNAIDGAGNVWGSNFETTTASAGISISELSSSGTAISGSTGYQGGALDSPENIAIDGSGNVWVQSLSSLSSSSYITEFVGAATPVVTPIVAGLPATPTVDGSSNLGTRP